MHKKFLLASNVVRFVVPYTKLKMGESNLSLISRIAWKYRVNPGKLFSRAILMKPSMWIDLKFNIAASSNSITDKSIYVANKLYELTGQNRSRGNFSYLRNILDHGAHGFISKNKKWCHLCYQERVNSEDKNTNNEQFIFDELYWSVSKVEYCKKHLCTLSFRCGTCFESQPYISSKSEPGYCHFCGYFLGKAPSIEICDGPEYIAAAEKNLSRLDILLDNEIDNSRLTIHVLAKNLRELINQFDEDEDGEEIISGLCSISSSTLVDWCRARNNLSLESLLLLVDGLGLQNMKCLFIESKDFCSLVASHKTYKFNFNKKISHSDILQEITVYLNEIIDGVRSAESRISIAKYFGVSKGMLENAFRPEIKQVSQIYETQKKIKLQDIKNTVQQKMNRAVRRCGSKMRKFDWAHILAELNVLDLNGLSSKEIFDARDKAIDSYLNSKLRDRSRDISRLLE